MKHHSVVCIPAMSRAAEAWVWNQGLLRGNGPPELGEVAKRENPDRKSARQNIDS
jgi:hypothetical protein